MSTFEEYIRQGEPDRSVKAAAWQTAIGLQDVDGLKPSEYLVETARRHIEGDVTIQEVKGLIDTYYKSRAARLSEQDTRTEEADKVSARITEILQEETFSFTPAELQRIHRRLFEGIFKFAGKFRNYNISKKEWVLNGATVLYNPCDNLKETLDYDFSEEKKFDYSTAKSDEAIGHIASFIAGIWQIHPFGEGNTRTTAVFLIRYLRSFGYSISNELFASHSWYFRNALVRANYFNREKGIVPNSKYLEDFLRNLILGENNELRNRYLHIDYPAQSDTDEISKGQAGTLRVTLEELAVLKLLLSNPRMKQTDIAAKIGKSERTVKRITDSLKGKEIIVRRNGKRDGWWEVLVPIPED